MKIYKKREQTDELSPEGSSATEGEGKDSFPAVQPAVPADLIPSQKIAKDKNSDKEKIKTPKEDKDKLKSKKRRQYVIKITIITLCLSLVFSFITEITATKSTVIISMLLLMFLILVSIVFDGIGVAATSCDIVPLLSMSARKVPGAKIAVLLVKNAEKVANICADVIGDICGIVSGACSVAIIIKFASGNPNSYLFNILLSSIVAALTVGGKALIKDVSIKNSKEMIMFASRVIGIFYKPKR